MALRLKTVEYALPFDKAPVTFGVLRTLTPITVNIPESAPTFRSVALHVHAQTNSTADMSAPELGITLGAAARSVDAWFHDFDADGEQQGVDLVRDVTAYFAANWSGPSMLCTVDLKVAESVTENVSAKLVVTYEYDDAAEATRLKTVRIPLEGNIAKLTTSFVAVGGVVNNVPALDTFLPEASKVYRSIFFEVLVNEGQSIGDAGLELRHDGATALDDEPHGTESSSRLYRRVEDVTATLTTSAAQTLEARTTSATATFPALTATLVVTYEYDHASSTRVINARVIPLSADEAAAGIMGGPTAADLSRFRQRFFVEEPGTIELVQSGVLFMLMEDDHAIIDCRVGAQPSRVFNHKPSTTPKRCGGLPFQRRFDAGAVGGEGATLDRGLNTITVDLFQTLLQVNNNVSKDENGTGLTGVLFVNYISDKHSDGADAHAHSVSWLMLQSVDAVNNRHQAAAAAWTPAIPEDSWWMDQVGIVGSLYASGDGFVTAVQWASLRAKLAAGEGAGAGWRTLLAILLNTSAEPALIPFFAGLEAAFKRHDGDPDPERMDLELARDLRFHATLAGHSIASWLLDYHSIKTSRTAQLVNYTGDGSGVAVNVFRSDTKERIAAGTTAVGGAFVFDWYDDTIAIYAVARQSAVLLARSDNSTGTPLALDLAAAPLGAVDLSSEATVVIFKGENKTVEFIAKKNGVPVDITGAVIHCTVRTAVGAADPASIDLDSVTNPTQFEVPLPQTDADKGKGRVKFLPANTSGLAVADYKMDIWIVLDGEQYTVVPPSTYKVLQPVTVL